MRDTYTIGLDYGTLSARAVLVSCRDGRILAEAEKKYTHGVIEDRLPADTAGGGAGQELPDRWCLQYPGDYTEALEEIVPAVMRQSGAAKENVIGLGIDFTSCTMLPIDQAGVPLCERPEFSGRRSAYAKLWKHHGAQTQTERINRVLEKNGLLDQPRFGGKISPELMVPKLLETLEEDRKVYQAADEFLEAGDWLTRVLTGSHDRSCSMAGYKAWWDGMDYPESGLLAQLDPRLADLAADKLPGRVKKMGDRLGTLSESWAERLGLAAGIAVAPAVIDSHAGFPGSGVSRPNQMMLVLGTSSVLIALSRTPFSGQGIMGGVRDGIVPGYYAYESGLAAVGDLYAWFVDRCVPAYFLREAEERGMDVYALLSEKAGQLRPGESGLLALDWWNGNKTPFVDGELTGCLLGMTLQTRPEELFRALIEATAFGTRRILELYEAHGAEAEEIIVSGGIAAKNPLAVQIYADILGKPLRVAAAPQAAALGSAIYAALAAGEQAGGYAEYGKAVQRMSVLTDRIYNPEPKNRTIYEKMYRLYFQFCGIMGQPERNILHALREIKTECGQMQTRA